MKKVLLIYNPMAGNNRFKNHLDRIINIVQNQGSYLFPYRSNSVEELEKLFKTLDLKTLDRIWIAGGDGTIHQVINSLQPQQFDIPIGIFPVGTANDFAHCLGYPETIPEITKTLLGNNYIPCDVGVANDRYFLNIASLGSIVDISQKTDKKFKSSLGLLAYYIKGAEELSHLKPVPVSIKSQEISIEEEVFFVLILNGRSAGGFRKIAPLASLTDGLLDVYILKKCPIIELLPLLIKVSNGEHADSRYVEYFQTSEMIIDCTEKIGSDLDGEKGFSFPLKISVEHQKLKMIIGNMNLKG